MRAIDHLANLAATALLLACGLAATTQSATASPAVAVSIDDFGYLDTSGEPTDQTAVHQKRLDAFMAALRGEVGGDARYHLVLSSCAQPCATEGPAFADRLQEDAKGGTAILITGSVQKMSTLVQWARTAAFDTSSHRMIFEKLFTFRGDNDEAWQRAESFIAEQIRSSLGEPRPRPAAFTPARIAVFPFELDDTSAAAQSTGETASDAKGLTDTTDAVRQALAQSGRYQLVDVSAASAEAAKTHALHDCDGCDATIARELGADQSLLGVIRRVSRTEYTVRLFLRDTSNGKIVAVGDSGLRMGANYSWSRGADRLVRDHLLEGGGQQ